MALLFLDFINVHLLSVDQRGLRTQLPLFFLSGPSPLVMPVPDLPCPCSHIPLSLVFFGDFFRSFFRHAVTAYRELCEKGSPLSKTSVEFQCLQLTPSLFRAFHRPKRTSYDNI